MANMQKYARHAVGHLCKHFERGLDSAGKPINYSNQEIDLSRSHLNYNLAPERKSQYEFITERCKEVYCLNRKDVNVMCSWCLTAPKDLPPEEHDRFFKAAYDFFENRYGKENVISAYVHKDETTPHLHYAWVPVHYDRQKERYAVSAKSVVNRKDLLSLHPDLEKHLTKALGHDVHVMTGELSTRPDMTLPQYKAMKKIEAQLEIAEGKLNEITKELKELEPIIVKFEEIDAIQPRETMTGALRGITLEDVEKMKMASKKLEALTRDFKKLHSEYEKTSARVPSLDDDLKRMRTEERLEKLEAALKTLPIDTQRQIENDVSGRSEPFRDAFEVR